MKTLEEVMGKVLAVDPKEIHDASSPDTLPSWDSFNGLALIQELEKNFGVGLPLEEMAGVRNVGDIKKVLRESGVQL